MMKRLVVFLGLALALTAEPLAARAQMADRAEVRKAARNIVDSIRRQCSELSATSPLRVGILGFDIHFPGLNDNARVRLRREVENAFGQINDIRLVPIVDRGKIIQIVRYGRSGSSSELSKALAEAGRVDVAVYFEGRAPSATKVEFEMVAYGSAKQCLARPSDTIVVNNDAGVDHSDFKQLMWNEVGKVIEDNSEIADISIRPFRYFSSRRNRGYNTCVGAVTEAARNALVDVKKRPNSVLVGRKLAIRLLADGEDPVDGPGRYVFQGAYGFDKSGMWIQGSLEQTTDGDTVAVVEKSYVTGIPCEPGEVNLFDLIESGANTDAGRIRITGDDLFRVRQAIDFPIRASAESLDLYCLSVDLEDKAYVLVAGPGELKVSGRFGPKKTLRYNAHVDAGDAKSYPAGITGKPMFFFEPVKEELFGCFGAARPLPASVDALWRKNFFAQPNGTILQIDRKTLLRLIRKTREIPRVYEAYKRFRVVR